MQPDEREEMEWLAFRYVAGEMNPAEAAAFEGRLADDQQAREAVCRAVALTGQLAAAGPPEARPQEAGRVAPIGKTSAAPIIELRSKALRAVGWMMVGAAAALLIVYLARPGASAPSNPMHSTEPSQARPSIDALVWARLQTASPWAGEQSQRWEDELDWPLETDALDAQRPSALPSWVHGTTRKERGKQ